MAGKRSEAAIGAVGRVGAEQALVEKMNLTPTSSARLPWSEAEGPA